jgi:hypothetical protein
MRKTLLSRNPAKRWPINPKLRPKIFVPRREAHRQVGSPASRFARFFAWYRKTGAGGIVETVRADFIVDGMPVADSGQSANRERLRGMHQRRRLRLEAGRVRGGMQSTDFRYRSETRGLRHGLFKHGESMWQKRGRRLPREEYVPIVASRQTSPDRSRR